MINISRAQSCDGYMLDTELVWLAQQAQTCKVVIEVGSWHGKSSRAIADNLPPDGVLYCVDTWDGSIAEQSTYHASAKMMEGDHALYQFLQNNMDLVQAGKIIPMRMSSKNASALMKEKGILADMIFIDAGHTYSEVTDDLQRWNDVVKPGGVFCGHDYELPAWAEVVQAVDHFFGKEQVTNIINTHIWCRSVGISQSNLTENYITPPALAENDNTPAISTENRTTANPATPSKITVGIPTCSRYEQLAHALVSIAHQSVLPCEVIIVDDTPVPIDLRNVPIYQHIFTLLHNLGVGCEVKFGLRKGQHHSHQMVQEIAKGNLVFRMDDDCIAQPNVLQTLRDQMDADKTLGAVAPLVLMPDAPVGLPPTALNKITDLQAPNMQWYKWQGVRECEHLYSCFMYRKGITRYELSLSKVAHREETIFTHRIFREGYKLMVNANATVWHFRSETGGIRMHNNPQFYESDEQIFQNILKGWNINTHQKTIVVLDNGIGDHYAFKNILPKLRIKSRIGSDGNLSVLPTDTAHCLLVFCCYPDVFYDEPDLQLGSIAEAKQLFGENLDKWSIYGWMKNRNWNKSIVEAYEKMYL